MLRVLILFSINKNLEDKKLLKLLNILSYAQLQTETTEKVTVHATMLKCLCWAKGMIVNVYNKKEDFIL